MAQPGKGLAVPRDMRIRRMAIIYWGQKTRFRGVGACQRNGFQSLAPCALRHLHMPCRTCPGSHQPVLVEPVCPVLQRGQEDRRSSPLPRTLVCWASPAVPPARLWDRHSSQHRRKLRLGGQRALPEDIQLQCSRSNISLQSLLTDPKGFSRGLGYGICQEDKATSCHRRDACLL